MKTLILPTAWGGWIFSLSSLAALVVVALIAFSSLKRDGHSLRDIVLLMTALTVGFFLGETFFAHFPGLWREALTTGSLPPAEHRSLSGGVIGLAAALLAARHVLGMGRTADDAFAVALPAGLAISGIGCFFAGCCYGLPTDLPWGIRYDAASHAYLDQLGRGLIQPGATGSLAVHPVQLYLTAGCLLIAFLVHLTRKQWKNNGTQWIFSLICYGILAFVLEFWRASEDGSASFAGLTGNQWLLVIFAAAAGIRACFRKDRNETSVPAPASALRRGVVTAGVWFFFLAGRKWIPLPESLLVLLVLWPVTLYQVIGLYRRHTVPGLRWVAPLVVLGSLGLMSQKSGTGDPDDESKFTAIGLYGMTGSYVEDLYLACSHSGCDSQWIELVPDGNQRRVFWQGAVDVSHNRWKGKYYRYAIGMRGYYGQEYGGRETDYPKSGYVVGLAPYVSFQWRYFGFSTGLMIGQNKIGIPREHDHFDDFSDGDLIAPDHVNSWVVPAITLRGGPSDIAFGEISFPAAFPSASPYPLFRVGVGTGFGRTDGTRAMIGYANGIFVQGSYPVTRWLVLEALYADRLGAGRQERRMLTAGIQFRIPGEKK
ncbi:MAG TPA: prolipoprotein diacylglyceryl transferase [Bacteroidales bacterium]|nr:prolipoprotein diacylglyceryl transferase [Bacteroidales bacterium]